MNHESRQQLERVADLAHELVLYTETMNEVTGESELVSRRAAMTAQLPMLRQIRDWTINALANEKGGR